MYKLGFVLGWWSGLGTNKGLGMGTGTSEGESECAGPYVAIYGGVNANS